MAKHTRYWVVRILEDGRMTAKLGSVRFLDREDGWRFNPNVAGRHPSRKAHATPERAVPRWCGSYVLEPFD